MTVDAPVCPKCGHVVGVDGACINCGATGRVAIPDGASRAKLMEVAWDTFIAPIFKDAIDSLIAEGKTDDAKRVATMMYRVRCGTDLFNAFLDAALNDLAKSNVAHFEESYNWTAYLIYERARDAAFQAALGRIEAALAARGRK